MDKTISDIAAKEAGKGFKSFKAWAERPGLGIVLTAHPTFSLSRDIRDCLGRVASSDEGDYKAEIKEVHSTGLMQKY